MPAPADERLELLREMGRDRLPGAFECPALRNGQKILIKEISTKSAFSRGALFTHALTWLIIAAELKFAWWLSCGTPVISSCMITPREYMSH